VRPLAAEMPTLVSAAAVVLGAAGLTLIVVCWRLRSVLGVVCGLAGVVSAVLGAASGHLGIGATDELVGALAAIVIGTVLLVLGQAIQRVLDREPDTRA
jgi:CHASE2 domain-containing sensor protein